MKIIAIIVTYNPDLYSLNKLIKVLRPQVSDLLIIDNASTNLHINLIEEKFHFIQLPLNAGLATGYNNGIQFAKFLGATHVILFDQDSLPNADMIETLVGAVGYAYENIARVAAVGPNYEDIKGSYRSPFVRLSGISLKRVRCERECIEVDHLISSGCLIVLDAFNEIGGFTDRLFIDYVDTEWCWRARRKGYRLLGVCKAKMKHNLGEAYFDFLGKKVIVHSPFRLYYQMRNQWWFILQPWIGWQWRLMDIIRSFKIFIALGVFAPNRRKNIYFMCRGVLDALRGRMGKLEVRDKDRSAL